MFLGQQRLSLDDDGNLVIPKPFREQFAEGVYVTRGFEQNLLIMSDGFFQEIYKRIVALNMADPVVRQLLRLILSNASRLEISESGYVSIPKDLISSADLEKDVILVGQGDYIEAWTPVNWEEQTTKALDTEANIERFARIDLALN